MSNVSGSSSGIDAMESLMALWVSRSRKQKVELRQGAEAQEVNLEQADRLDVVLVPLDDRAPRRLPHPPRCDATAILERLDP
jgi:hypothetical protein